MSWKCLTSPRPGPGCLKPPPSPNLSLTNQRCLRCQNPFPVIKIIPVSFRPNSRSTGASPACSFARALTFACRTAAKPLRTRATPGVRVFFAQKRGTLGVGVDHHLRLPVLAMPLRKCWRTSLFASVAAVSQGQSRHLRLERVGRGPRSVLLQQW